MTETPHPYARHRATLALGLSALAACTSTAEHVEDADREVYEIVNARREALAAGESFALTPEGTSLRDRLLAGEEIAPLGLLECLEVAAETNRDYQSRRESLYLSALDLTLERWRFSVQETGTFGAFLDGRGGDPTTDAGIVSNLGLSKLIGTGLSMFGNVGVDLVRDVGSGDGWDAVSNFSLNITQPLLRGFGRDIVMEPLTQAERNVLYEARSYERFRRTFAIDVASRFFRVVQQEDVLENEVQNLERVVKLRERNEAFAEAGLLNDIQVDQARQDELSAQTRIIDSRRNFEGQLDDFKLFLGLPIDAHLELERGDWLSLDAWQELNIEFFEDRVIDVALQSRLDYLTQLDRVEDARRRVAIDADSLGWGLDVSASVSGNSESNNLAKYDHDSFRGTLSLDIDTPLDVLPERNAYRESLIRLDVAERNAEELADIIRADLRDSLRRLAAGRDNYEIQTGAVSLAERRVESAELNLEAGRADTRTLLESQRDLVSTQNAAAGSLTEYVLAGLGLYRDMELIRVGELGIEIDTDPLQH